MKTKLTLLILLAGLFIGLNATAGPSAIKNVQVKENLKTQSLKMVVRGVPENTNCVYYFYKEGESDWSYAVAYPPYHEWTNYQQTLRPNQAYRVVVEAAGETAEVMFTTRF